ncbi:DoxX family membrane protein [Pedobacter sp. MC2016-05]|uniref:DoxX family membrane protein n=1 Tax=Pedobacter sp. MC2016-05 TaxID=2994474 RepID=UPI00224862A5|nr:DoxX family membrane protein [Pedobacter sp. MC2016-05]MCX2477316.1 DoxX family membrane protein [Pedobacter sp. MC2016-05]
MQTFAAGMVKNFEQSWLPKPLVQLFGHTLPFVELIIGSMLIVGFKTRWANFAGATLIITLLFGSRTIENWEAMGMQMVYAFMFYFLIAKQQDNIYSLDKNNLK